MLKLFLIKSAYHSLTGLGAPARIFFGLRSFGMSSKGVPRSQERPSQQSPMLLTSSAFGSGEMIPKKYTCEGENVSPPLEILNVPIEAQSLALVVHDGDAPTAGGWTHWVVFNIDPLTIQIPAGSFPEGAIEGETSAGVSGYGGPCPPSGTHHYEFRLCALDSHLALGERAREADLEQAMVGHIISQTTLIGLYHKKT